MKTLYSIKMRASSGDQHVSGAEGIYERGAITEAVSKYCERALDHPKGKPDEITLKVRVLDQEPLPVPLLNICTVDTSSIREAKMFLRECLLSFGISGRSTQKAFDIVYSRNLLRGAAVLTMSGAMRLDPDRKRGVRATELGITGRAAKTLAGKLGRFNLNTDTVKEAVILASKIASFEGVVAEICVSDDPDYTTGYVASPHTGYVRVPHIKRRGEEWGGRVVFVRDSIDMEKLKYYLENTPVMINRISEVSGTVSIHEFIGNTPR